MTKHDILETFKDIDFMYNDSTRLDTLSRMIDELLYEQETEKHDCRDCWHWLTCPNGMRGHILGTSIGFSIGECKDFRPIT